MSKAQIPFIYQSNSLEALALALKEELYAEGSGPFASRLIIVPNLGLKSFLLSYLAKDPKRAVAAGLNVVNMSQGFSKLSKSIQPSSLELSLFIHSELPYLIDRYDELASYFGTAARERRLPPFADSLARSFLSYGTFGKRALPLWQEELYAKVVEKWTLPVSARVKATPDEVHLFGFTFLSACHFDFFSRAGARFYLFSPCATYWGESEHPLLSLWGGPMRSVHLMVEESGHEKGDLFLRPSGGSALALLQRGLLEGTLPPIEWDPSIELATASSPMREVEILKDSLLAFFEEGGVPSEVQVFAPDISIYAPFIKLIFGSEEDPIPYGIADLKSCDVDLLVKGFVKLMELTQNRFSVDATLALFSSPLFAEKFELKPETIARFRKWTERAKIRWGYSEEQRRLFYAKDFERVDVHTPLGTWEWGIDALLFSLTDDGRIQVQWTETSELSTLCTLLDSLADDLAPLIDGTKWTFGLWARYFGCLIESYFQCDGTHPFYTGLQELAAQISPLDERVTYEEAKRIWESFALKKSGGVQSPHLQSVSFQSLSEGAIRPCQKIALLGMGEGAFPKTEGATSLHVQERTYRPSRGETDRSLFLQVVMSTKKSLSLSYVRDPHGKLGAALPAAELVQTLKGAKWTDHPERSHDPSYFTGELHSYSRKRYEAACASLSCVGNAPLIPHFFAPRPLTLPGVDEPITIELSDLFQFARHPLRYYLKKVLKLAPDLGAAEDRGEFLLSPLQKSFLVREGLHRPVDEVITEAKERGELPLNLCRTLAKEQIEKEVALWEEGLSAHGLSKEDLETISIDTFHTLENGQEVRLIGSVDHVTRKGIVCRGSGTLSDEVRMFPQALLGLGPLLFLEKGEKRGATCLLEEYLTYFLMARQHPSPLLPSLAKPLLTGTEREFAEAFAKEANDPDETLAYLLYRDPPPSPGVIYATWAPYLQTLFGGLVATV